MKIIILDGFAANPGDLSWEGIKALGECVIYDRTAPEEVLERAAGAEVLLTNKVIINAEHMAALPELKYIGPNGICAHIEYQPASATPFGRSA